MRLTKRGRRVRAVAIVAGLLAIYWVSGHLWVDGGRICIGTMLECV